MASKRHHALDRFAATASFAKRAASAGSKSASCCIVLICSNSSRQLRSAEQGGAAIQVLDLGLKRFPEDATLLALIEEAKQAPAAGSEELEMLRSLGYVP